MLLIPQFNINWPQHNIRIFNDNIKDNIKDSIKDNIKDIIVMAGLSAIKIKTILLDTFIELPVDEVNKLKNNHFKDVLNDEIDEILPESLDI